MRKEDYIKECVEKYGNRYSYILLPEEFGCTDRIPLICPIHGEFLTTARNHKNSGSGCPYCGKEKAKSKNTTSLDEFKRKVEEVHGDKFIVIDETYVKTSDYVVIKCNTCGNTFKITGRNLLAGYGCPHCHPFPKKLTHQEFVEKLNKLMPNLEVLSEYKSTRDKITIRCKIHDYTFTTTPKRLFAGNNCQKCYDERRGETNRKDVETLLEELGRINDYTYPYIESEYKNNKSKLTVICPEHGEFKMSANKLLKGQKCSKCSCTMMENYVKHILEEHNIKYVYEKKFDWLKGVNNGNMSLDFYLEEYNVAIECQGEQHFVQREHFGDVERFNRRLENDILKYNLCLEHEIPLYYIIQKKYLKNSKDSIFNGIYSDNSIVFEELLKSPLSLLNQFKIQ